MRLTFATLFLLTLSMPGMRGQSVIPTPQQTESARNPFMRIANNGLWWDTLSADSKTDFVDGFVTAMADVHRMLIGFVKKNKNEVTPGPNFDAQVSAVLQLSVIAGHYEYDEVGREKLHSGVDTFYKDPLNKFIPIEFAFQWERDTLNGKVAPRDLQKQLDEWRAAVNKQ
jgi:hypothetical protein